MRRLAAAVAGLLLTLLPSPASAAAESTPFHLAPCYASAMTDVTFDEASYSMVLNGVVTQCAPAIEYGGFRLALFNSRSPFGQSRPWQARRFEGPVAGEVRPYAIRLLGVGTATYGICLLAAGSGSGQEIGGRRVDCARVVQPKPQTSPPTATLEPLATTDPLVDKWVLADPVDLPPGTNGEPDGICPACF